MYPVEDLADFLGGDWRIQRKFSDRTNGERADFRGRASFTPGDDPPAPGQSNRSESVALRYFEEIHTELKSYSGLSTRAYGYRFDTPATARVSFEDGAAFHNLDLSSGLCRVQHLCAPDTYDGVFRAVSQDEWLVRWKVTGPRKHYIIESRFIRSRR